VIPGRDGQGSGSGSVRSLVLRAWPEPDAEPGIRIRMVEIGPGQSERPVAVTASVDDACEAVRRWLEARQAFGAGSPAES
jgi:hypothetical protein